MDVRHLKPDSAQRQLKHTRWQRGVVVVLIYAMLLSPSLHALGGTGSIIPTPTYPALYIPKDSKLKLHKALEEKIAQGMTLDDAAKAVVPKFQDQLATYPFVTPGADGSPVQQTFFKPYGDWVFNGQFYKGPKRHYMRVFFKHWVKAKGAIRELLKHVNQKGTLGGFGFFDAQKNFVPSALLDPSIKKHVETYVTALTALHERIRIALTYPTEYLDPDVLLDMTNAIGMGPQFRGNETLVKQGVSRFCTTSYLYRHLKTTSQATLPPTVDVFSKPYYIDEAQTTLATRMTAFKTQYQKISGQSLKADVTQNIQALLQTWVLVPVFEGKTPTHHVSPLSFYIPLWQKEGSWQTHPVFNDYATLLGSNIHFAPKAKSKKIETHHREVHTKLFWRSLGLNQSTELLKQNPFAFVRFKDQYVLLRGLYDAKGIQFTGAVPNQLGLLIYESDTKRGFIEDVMPQLICESLYRRNFITRFSLAQRDASTQSNDLKDLPKIAAPLFNFWHSGEMAQQMISALEGQSFRHDQALRPWSVVDRYYQLGQWVPNLHKPLVSYDEIFQHPANTLSFTGDVLPHLFPRFSSMDRFHTLFQKSGLGTWSQQGLTTLVPEIEKRVNTLVSEATQRSPYQLEQAWIVGAEQSSSSAKLQKLLTESLATSRVLFTPQELTRLLRAYFQDVLQPLVVLTRYMPTDSFSDGLNAAAFNHFKRFFMPAGMIHRELIALLQTGHSDLVQAQSAIWKSDQSEVVPLNEISSKPQTHFSENGVVISMAHAFMQPLVTPITMPEWSKHDKLKSATTQLNRHLTKRALWCNGLPLQIFSSIQSKVDKSVSLETIRTFVCAVPGLYHAAQKFGLQLANQHLHFEAVKDQFTVSLPLAHYDKKMLPYMHHVQSPQTLHPDYLLKQKNQEEKKDTLTLRKGLSHYAELQRLWDAYQKSLSTFESAPYPISDLVKEGRLNWDLNPEIYNTKINGKKMSFDLKTQVFDTQCSPKLKKDINAFLNHRPILELKMLCLFNRTKQMRNLLYRGYSDITLTSSNKTVNSPYGKAIQMGFYEDLSESTSEGYLRKLMDRMKSFKGSFKAGETCQKDQVTLSTSFSEISNSTDGSSNTFNEGLNMPLKAALQESFGSYAGVILKQACDQNTKSRFSSLFKTWKSVLTALKADKTIQTYYGDAVLFSGSKDAYPTLRSNVKSAYDQFLTLVHDSRLKRSDDDFRKLMVELAMAYRDLKFEGLIRNYTALKLAQNTKDALNPISPVLPTDKRLANAVITLPEYGKVDFFSSLTGIQFGYRRDSTLSDVIDFVGLGHSGDAGTTFEYNDPNASDTFGFTAFSNWAEDGLCQHATSRGGRLVPWLATHSSSSIREDMRGFRLSVWNHSHPNSQIHEVVSQDIFCKTRISKRNRDGEFRPLTHSELLKIDEANAFLGQVQDTWDDKDSTRIKAHNNLTETWMQAVVLRVFIDKVKTHILMPYKDGLKQIVTFFKAAQKILLMSSQKDLKAAQSIFKLLEKHIIKHRKGKKLLKHAYFRQLFVSMLDQLFPNGNLQSVTKKHLTQILTKLYGHQLVGEKHEKSFVSKTKLNVFSSEDEKERYTKSILAHLVNVIQETEAFLAQLGQTLTLRYPMLEEEMMERVDGNTFSTASYVPKRYHYLFAKSVFDIYRGSDASKASFRDIKKSNRYLKNVMPENNLFYGSKQDRIDDALEAFTKSYVYAPSQFFTHRMNESGKHYNRSSFSFHKILTAIPDAALYTPQKKKSFLSITYHAEEDEEGNVEIDKQQPLTFTIPVTGKKLIVPKKQEGAIAIAVQNIFPWLKLEKKPYPHSVSQYAYAVSQQSAQGAGELSLFQAFAESNEQNAKSLKIDSASRNSFDASLSKIYKKQEGIILTELEKTLRDIYLGEGSLSELKMVDLKATAIQLYSNSAIVKLLEQRYGDRFLELKFRFLPHQVTSYIKGEHVTMNLMSDIAKVFGVVAFVGLFVAVSMKLVGLLARGTKLAALAGRLPAWLKWAPFLIRHSAVLLLSTAGSYTLFRYFNQEPNFFALMIVSLLMMLPVTWYMSRTGSWSVFLNRVAMRQAVKFWGFDVLFGVVIMDVVGAVLNWNAANHALSAYMHNIGLLYTHVQYSRTHKALMGEDTPFLIQDINYVHYLERNQAHHIAASFVGNILAWLVNSGSLYMWRRSVKHAKQAERALGATVKADVDTLLDNLSQLIPASETLPLKSLKESSPEEYVKFLILISDEIEGIGKYLTKHRTFQKMISPSDWAQVTKDQKELLKVLWKDGVETNIGAALKGNLTMLDEAFLGLRSTFKADRFPDLSDFKHSSSQAEEGMSILLQSNLTRFFKEGFLSKTDMDKLSSLFVSKYVKSPFALAQTFGTVPSHQLQNMLNGISAAVYRKTGNLSDVIQVRMKLLHDFDRYLGFRLFGERAWRHVMSADDISILQRTLESIWNQKVDIDSVFSKLLNSDKELKKLQDEAQKLGLELNWSRIQSLRLSGETVMENGFGILVSRTKNVTQADSVRNHPLFHGEIRLNSEVPK